jgi:hypothetical protein
MAKGHTFQIGFRVEGGRFEIEPGAISDAVKSWPDCEGVLTLDTEEKRSSAANRYLWSKAVYGEIEKYTGQDKQDIHDEMCARFTTETITRIDPGTGEMIEFEVVRGTSGMKVSRFHKFVEDVKLFWMEFGGLTFEEPGDDVRQERERAMAREVKRDPKATMLREKGAA